MFLDKTFFFTLVCEVKWRVENMNDEDMWEVVMESYSSVEKMVVFERLCRKTDECGKWDPNVEVDAVELPTGRVRRDDMIQM